MDKYPGSNYQEIKIWGEEETKTQLEESHCEGLKENGNSKQAQHIKNQN